MPYIATSNGKVNCLACHLAKEGEVLGVVTVKIDATSTRLEGVKVAFYSSVLLLLGIVFGIFYINRFLASTSKVFSI